MDINRNENIYAECWLKLQQGKTKIQWTSVQNYFLICLAIFPVWLIWQQNKWIKCDFLKTLSDQKEVRENQIFTKPHRNILVKFFINFVISDLCWWYVVFLIHYKHWFFISEIWVLTSWSWYMYDQLIVVTVILIIKLYGLYFVDVNQY